MRLWRHRSTRTDDDARDAYTAGFEAGMRIYENREIPTITITIDGILTRFTTNIDQVTVTFNGDMFTIVRDVPVNRFLKGIAQR